VSPGRGWELDGPQSHLEDLFLRHPPPTHIYKIWMVLVYDDQSKWVTLFIFTSRRGVCPKQL
jgi:hypothetical protein